MYTHSPRTAELDVRGAGGGPTVRAPLPRPRPPSSAVGTIPTVTDDRQMTDGCVDVLLWSKVEGRARAAAAGAGCWSCELDLEPYSRTAVLV
jgi:hypothetical protein